MNEYMQKKLAEIGFASLEAYFQSDLWKSFRDKYKRSGLPQFCQCCGSAKTQLHHRYYHRLGCERLSDVVPLCGVCHAAVHEAHRAHDIPLHNTNAAISVVRDGILPGKQKRCVRIGLVIRSLLQQGVPYVDAIRRAYRMAGKEPPSKVMASRN